MQHTVEVPLAPQSGCRADPGAPPWPRCPPQGPPLCGSPGKQTAGCSGFILRAEELNKNIQELCGSCMKNTRVRRQRKKSLKHNDILGQTWICKNVHMKTQKHSCTRGEMKRINCLKTSLGIHTKKQFLHTGTSERRMPDGPWRPHVIRDCNPVMASLISSSKS